MACLRPGSVAHNLLVPEWSCKSESGPARPGRGRRLVLARQRPALPARRPELAPCLPASYDYPWAGSDSISVSATAGVAVAQHTHAQKHKGESQKRTGKVETRRFGLADVILFITILLGAGAARAWYVYDQADNAQGDGPVSVQDVNSW